jgi:RHS repeat-associated protein
MSEIIPLYGSQNSTYSQAVWNDTIGKRSYELSNHLGNVLTVISDRKIPVDSNTDGIVDYYEANIISATDYYPFGSPMPGRTFTSESYRYGFQNQEKLDEISGEGNHYSAEYWEYDPRLGRRWNIDPVVKHHESPYACFANNPIWFIDPNGADTLNGNKVETDANKLESLGAQIESLREGIKVQKANRDKIKGQIENIDTKHTITEILTGINPFKSNPITGPLNKHVEGNEASLTLLYADFVRMELSIVADIDKLNDLIKGYNQELGSLKLNLTLMDSDDSFAVVKGDKVKYWNQNKSKQIARYRLTIDGVSYRFGFGDSETKPIIHTLNTKALEKQISPSFEMLGIDPIDAVKMFPAYKKQLQKLQKTLTKGAKKL